MSGYVYPGSYFESKNNNIILSEEVYARLHGLINITAFKKNMTDKNLIKSGYEYGGWLLGRIDNDGNINLTELNENSDYQVLDGSFHAFSAEKMSDEILGNPKKGIKGKIEDPRFNCLVHVHTHPANTLSGRCFSESDLKLYKALSSIDYEIFGCMLSTSLKGKIEDDDISFIKYNKNSDTFNYYPNVYWKNKNTGEIKKLKHVDCDYGKHTVFEEETDEFQK